MKYYHICANLKFIRKPSWIDEYRKHYDQDYKYHITLKNPTEVEEQKTDKIRAITKRIAGNYYFIPIAFEKIKINLVTSGYCIMIVAEDSPDLNDLQKEIRTRLKGYGQNVSEEYGKFENNFDPHLTIARGINKNNLKQVKKDLKPDTRIKALVNSLTLSIVSRPIPEEWLKIGNKIIYDLKTS